MTDAPTPTAPAVPPTGAPAPPEFPAQVTTREAATVAQWIKEDLAAGKLSPDAAAKAFDELQTPMEQREPDKRSEEQKELSRHFPVARPEEYLIRWGDPGQDAPEMTPEMTAFDTSARTWMSDAGFHRELGNSLVNIISKVAEHTEGMSPVALELYERAEYKKLEQVYGDKLDDKLREAGRMVEALDAKNPGLKQLLRSHGIGDTALVVSLLIQQSDRWHVRKGR